MELTLYQLINPLAFTVFAGGFITLYLYDTRRRAAGIWAISYLLGASAFLIDILRDSLPAVLSSWGSNALYVLTALAFSLAVHTHCRRDVPWRVIVPVIVGIVAAFAWYRWADPDVRMRILALNLGTSLIFATCLPPLIGTRGRLSVERFLGIVMAIFCIQLVLRPLLTMWWLEPQLTSEAYVSSLASVLFQVSTGVTALIVAMAVFLMLGIRIASELRHEADSDPLTGLLNRRGFDLKARSALERLARMPGPFSVVVADIDRFKTVNDTWGHAAGDRVIQTLAVILQVNGRTGDHVARMGGEEFAIALWGTDAAGAAAYADRRRAAFAAMPIDTLPDGRNCTVSLGVAERRPGEPLETLLARADQALYEAKRRGRNRVVVAGRSPPLDPSAMLTTADLVPVMN